MPIIWIIWVVPECHHKYPYNREAKKNDTNRGEDYMETEMWLQVKESPQLPEAGRAKERTLARASRGSTALPTP